MIYRHEKLIVFAATLMALCSCNNTPKVDYMRAYRENLSSVDTSHTDNISKQIEPIFDDLVLREYSEFDERTKVSFIGVKSKSSLYLTASYIINERDILKKRYDRPRVEDLMLSVVVGKKGASDIDRIEVKSNKVVFTMRPNYITNRNQDRKFCMVFYVSSDESFEYIEALSLSDYAEFKVVFDNGSEVYNLTKEELGAVKTIYKCFLEDKAKNENITVFLSNEIK